ncbi:Cilia- and flagella-associated protein 44 [Channa argus]|uniref:Cilia-and flagella-associated protein 44 n=1 Tax=Channa argus TaxID=215402 RepID=A0A6G1QIP7_CHAAH|nr:Cilia- and flagella-associated protein 44 [Channa argus]
MADENTASVGAQEDKTQTTSQENTEGCDTDPTMIEEEAQEQSQTLLSGTYKYEDLHSRPTITPDSEIPENLLHLSHSFGYDSGRRANLQLLDDRTLIFIAGGTEEAYSFVDFNRDGSLLASMGSAPDYMLMLWNWRQEEVVLSCKAISQDVYRVSFSPNNPWVLTSCGSGHIKFWKMASTFTGLKLEGHVGHFGKTVATDIEGFVELPDGKVVSGSDWGNLLVWDGNAIKVEICRKEGRSCHAGMVRPFTLEDGQLMTMGSDGAVRGWDFESIDTADSESSKFEMEPMNEMRVGHNVCLTSVVKSSLPDSFIWFAQVRHLAHNLKTLVIHYVTSSQSQTLFDVTPDPQCLFTFHAGPIRGLDVSKTSHLMATTTMDRSVRVFDFLAKTELITSRFNRGGTTLIWAPPLGNQSAGLLVTGFEDGVVRLLELYDPQRLEVVAGRNPKGDAKLRLKQAFKPHNAPVTAVAYERNGDVLATGSSDCTVFFFTVGETYDPIGFVHVPGPVQGLEWSPHSHSDNRLLILCQSGHVIEVQSPDRETEKLNETFELPELPRRSFRFRSIKSRIKREEEIARRQAIKEKKKKEREERLKESKEPDTEEEEEKEEDELPPIYIPDPPSPLYCGFYSLPGQFWLSMGGYDSGSLYHCKFSEKQDEDADQRQDEPFGFLPVHNTDDDPIRSVTFSSNRQLLFCGMHSGSIRVYPLQPGDHDLTSMEAYWALTVHDNQYGHLQHICCSHDDHFVLTGGDDGNIFSFSLLPLEEIQKALQTKRAKVPSPRAGLENETLAQDIEDPAAYSIETAKQKLEKDRMFLAAELKIAEKRKKLAELQKTFKQLLNSNQSLPEHVRLKPALDPCFKEQAERVKIQRVMEVRKQLEWEEERSQIALSKIQDWFRDTLETSVITVIAICSNHRVSTYRLPVLPETSAQLRHLSKHSQLDGSEAAALQHSKSQAESTKSKIEEAHVLSTPVARPTGIKLGDRQIERLRKAAEKAEQAQARIEKRKQEWAQLYAEKPDENYEDPKDVRAIQKARETIGDLKLKSAKDFTVPIHLRMNAEKKRAELIGLEENIREKQLEMNRRIVALRDSKVCLVEQLKAQAQQLQQVQQHLKAHLHCPAPILPTMQPEETPEKKLLYSRALLERYRVLRKQRLNAVQLEELEGTASVLEQLEKEMEGQDMKKAEEESQKGEKETPSDAVIGDKEETAVGKDVELSELEEELRREEEIRLLHEQHSLLEQIENSVLRFDSELMLLRHQKLHLDCQLKLADLCQLTFYQELVLLKEFERRENNLQEKLNERIREENSITLKLKQCNEQLQLKHREIAKLQEREKALITAFQALLGENNKFEEFLTKVFKKKIKRVKKKEQTVDDEEEVDSDENSDEDDDWDDDDNYDSGAEEGEGRLDDSVCPPGCEPALYEKILQLREHRLDLEEFLVEEKKSAEFLKKEFDTLIKKEKTVKSNRQVVEDDLELVNKEKQQKMNELDVVVPLRLHQIEFVTGGSVPSDLSLALVLDRLELNRLRERIKQLQVEKIQQRELYFQARQQHIRLIHDRKEMNAKIQMLEKQCEELMMMKYGRLEKVEEARQAMMEMTKSNTERLVTTTNLFDQKEELEHKLNSRQKKMSRQFEDYRRLVDQKEIWRLQNLVKTQSQQADALKREIVLLSFKGGHVLPLGQAPVPPLAPLPTPTNINTIKQQRLFKYLKARGAPSEQGSN